MDAAKKKKRSRWETLLIIDIVFFLFLLIFHARVPVQDGDSFEYAGIARNILRSGTLQEDLLRNYCIKDQTVPHPASLRANLYVYCLVPFYAIFRDSQWTFIFPALIGLFVLPLVVFRVGVKLFSEEAAYYAALLSLFAPSVLRLYTFMDPGLPEVWQMIFYLLFVLVMLEEKYVVAGILMGAAFLFKRNSVVLIPAALLWLAVFRRKHLFGFPVIKIFGIALAMVLPFLVRSYLVFDDPFYNEQFAGLSRPYSGQMLDQFAEGDLFGIIFNYKVYQEMPPPPPVDFEHKIDYLKQVIGTNLKLAFFGEKNSIFYIPGFFQSFVLLLVPFAIYGYRKNRGTPASWLIAAIILLQVVMHAMMAIYSDRYIMCVQPLVFLFAAHGLVEGWRKLSEGLGLRTRKSAAWAVVLFVLLTESAGYMAMAVVRIPQAKVDSVQYELRVSCDRIREMSGGDTILMTSPFLSSHFICDMKTVPLPWGTMDSVGRAVEKYNVGYVIYSRVWPGDLFPEPPFTKTVSRGRYVSVFKVDPELLQKFTSNPDESPTAGINPVGYFLSNRFNFELSPPFYKLCAKYTRSAVLGIVAYLIALAVFVYAVTLGGGILRSGMPVTIVTLIVLFTQVKHVGAVFKPMTEANPQISRIQAEQVIKTFPEEKREIVFVINKTNQTEYVMKDLKPFFTSVTSAEAEFPPISEEKTMFIPIPGPNTVLADQFAMTENIELHKQRAEKEKKIMEKYEGEGFTAVPIYGGVFVY